MLNKNQTKKSLIKYTKLIVTSMMLLQFVLFIPTSVRQFIDDFSIKAQQECVLVPSDQVITSTPSEITIGPGNIDFMMAGMGTLNSNGNLDDTVSVTVPMTGEPIWEQARVLWGTTAHEQTYCKKNSIKVTVAGVTKEAYGTRFYNPGDGDQKFQSSDSYISSEGDLTGLPTNHTGQITITFSDLQTGLDKPPSGDPENGHANIGAGIILPFTKPGVYQKIIIHPFGYDVYDEGTNGNIDIEGFSSTLSDIKLSNTSTDIKAGFFFGETEYSYRKCRPSYLQFDGGALNPTEDLCTGFDIPELYQGIYKKIPKGSDGGWFDTRVTGTDLDPITTSTNQINFNAISTSFDSPLCSGDSKDLCNGESFTFMASAVAYPVAQNPTCDDLVPDSVTITKGKSLDQILTTSITNPAQMQVKYNFETKDMQGIGKLGTITNVTDHPEQGQWEISSTTSSLLEADQTYEDAAWVEVSFDGGSTGGLDSNCSVDLVVESQELPKCTDLVPNSVSITKGKSLDQILTTSVSNPENIPITYGFDTKEISGIGKLGSIISVSGHPEQGKWTIASTLSNSLTANQTYKDAAWVRIVWEGGSSGGSGSNCSVDLVVNEAPPVGSKDFSITKQEISSGNYQIGNEVKFKIVIQNTGDKEFDVVYFKDQYNRSFLSFQNAVLYYKSSQGTLKNTVDITSKLYSNNGFLYYPDLTQLLGENFKPGESYEVIATFTALMDTSTTCNIALADADAIQKFAQVCIGINKPPELPKTDR